MGFEPLIYDIQLSLHLGNVIKTDRQARFFYLLYLSLVVWEGSLYKFFVFLFDFDEIGQPAACMVYTVVSGFFETRQKIHHSGASVHSHQCHVFSNLIQQAKELSFLYQINSDNASQRLASAVPFRNKLRQIE